LSGARFSNLSVSPFPTGFNRIRMTYPSIMKARKTMKNQPLIQEVISQISQRFTPKIPDIKKVCFRLASLLKAQNS
jgi:hypothetical protein